MLKDNGSMMSQPEISKFYQNGKDGIYSKYNGDLKESINPQEETIPEENKYLAYGEGGNYNFPSTDDPVPDFINNPNIPRGQKKQMIEAYHSGQDQTVNTGTQKRGVDWRAIGSIVGAFGAAPSGDTLAETISNGIGGVNEHLRDVKSYNAYKPYYDKMGVDTRQLNPAHGGSGYGQMTPDNIIKLQEAMANNEIARQWKNAMVQKYLNDSNGTNARNSGKTITYGDLMRLSPSFNSQIRKQIDFSNGKNSELLNTVLPSNLVQTYMPAKEVNMNYSGGTSKKITKSGTTTINYTGGTHSTKTNFGSHYPNPNIPTTPKTKPKLIY